MEIRDPIERGFVREKTLYGKFCRWMLAIVDKAHKAQNLGYLDASLLWLYKLSHVMIVITAIPATT